MYLFVFVVRVKGVGEMTMEDRRGDWRDGSRNWWISASTRTRMGPCRSMDRYIGRSAGNIIADAERRAVNWVGIVMIVTTSESDVAAGRRVDGVLVVGERGDGT
jgi:hypothetical protein